MIYLSITVELSPGVVKSYLTQFEEYHSAEQFLQLVLETRQKEHGFIQLAKPASLIRTQQGLGVVADPVDSVWVEATTVRTAGKMRADLAGEYRNAIANIGVPLDDALKQEIVQ